jgi:RNA polymerase sigma factor (sigma-70 family)
MSVESRQSDAELLEAVRNGKAAAYGALYERHAAAARVLARQLVRGEAEVEDIVAETFTKILDLVHRGGGPEIAFRPYLLTAVRRTVYDRGRKEISTGEIELYDPGEPFVDPALAGLERSMVARAFMSLPDRWRMVLWHTEVENARPADIAPFLGLTANGVAALAYRAREGLRQAYLQMHLADAPSQVCRPVLGKMGAYVRGGLAKRETRVVDDHVAECVDCRELFAELTDVNRSMGGVIGPLIAGPAVAGYLAGLGKAGASGGLGTLVGWVRRGTTPRNAAVAGTAVVLVAGSFLLMSGEEPVEPPASRALPPPAATQEPSPPAEPPPPPPPPPPDPPAPPTRRPPADAPAVRAAERPRLVATIAPLGALVQARPGIVGIRLRNEGEGASKELVASVDLPPGVTLLASGGHGRGVGPADPVGTVDGWTCRPETGGARCTRGPLAPGRVTAVFMRVMVAPEAPRGRGPAVRVAAGRVEVAARAAAGVREAGAAARFATDGRIATFAVGNTLLTCPPVQSGCAEARRREGGSRDNDLWEMWPADADGDRTTGNSSAARLSLPRGGKVVWAGLYWSGRGPVRTAGNIKIRPPGQTGYIRVRASQVTGRTLPNGRAYQAFADVTRLVSGARQDGRWWVADAQVREGVAHHAGWSLVVIASDPRRPYSQAVVLDTATVLGRKRGPLEMPLSGLTSTASPAWLHLVTWEGDADLDGDQVTLTGEPLRPAGGDRDAGNAFDGSANGAVGPTMTFGVDVDTFRPIFGDRPVLRVSTKKDVVLFGVAVVSVYARS